MFRSPLLWLLVILAALFSLTALAPAEKTLGTNARVVYLHGAWVWAALAGLGASAGLGLIGLVARSDALNRWSRALGRTGMVFWITYLPLSLWAMQANWNGLFLAEPRWRLALIYSVAGLLLQTGLAFLGRPAWAAAGNLAFFLALLAALQQAENVMHPPSPILDSHAPAIQWYFALLLILAFLAVWQVARGWHRLEQASSAHLLK